MKFLKIVGIIMILILSFVIVSIILREKPQEILDAPKMQQEQSSDNQEDEDMQIHFDFSGILNQFFKNDLPVENLVVNIENYDAQISGDIDKDRLKTYLDMHNLLDFKTKTALLALPQTVNAKINLTTNFTETNFSIIAKQITIEGFSVNTNFTLYSANF